MTKLTFRKATTPKEVLRIENGDVSSAIGAYWNVSDSFVGSYVLGKNKMYTAVRVNLVKKPNWFHRTMMKLFFGIIWEDKS